MEQRVPGVDSRANREPARRHDAPEVLLAVQRPRAQHLEVVAAALHVGLGYEPVGAFRVAVGYPRRAVPPVEDELAVVVDHAGKGAERVELGIVRHRGLPCVERGLCGLFRHRVLVVYAEEVLLEVVGRHEHAVRGVAAQVPQGRRLGRLEVARALAQGVGEPLLELEAPLLVELGLQGFPHGVEGLVGPLHDVEVVNDPGGVRRVLGKGFPEGAVHVAAHPHHALEALDAREVLLQIRLSPAGHQVEDRLVLQIGHHRHHAEAGEVLLVDAQQLRHPEPQPAGVLANEVDEDVLHSHVRHGVAFGDLAEGGAKGPLRDVGVRRIRHLAALVDARDPRLPDVPAVAAPQSRELDRQPRPAAERRRVGEPRRPLAVAVELAAAFGAGGRLFTMPGELVRGRPGAALVDRLRADVDAVAHAQELPYLLAPGIDGRHVTRPSS